MSGLAFNWVYHRELTKRPSELSAPSAELELAPERLPRAVWLSTLPPILVAALLWWITVHLPDLPWARASSGPQGINRSYRFFTVSLVLWNGLALWMFLVALASWNGLSRAYEYRRTLLLTTLGNQWLVLLFTTALLCGIAFRLPALTKPVIATVALPCILVLLWNARRLNRLFAASPGLGSWFYFEPQDPAFLSRRGINAASPWAWALAAVPIAAILLVDLLLQAVEVI